MVVVLVMIEDGERARLGDFRNEILVKSTIGMEFGV